MNDVSTKNIVRLSLHEHQMLQVQQMRMIIIGPEIFSKIVSNMKNNTNAVYISLMLKCEPAVT